MGDTNFQRLPRSPYIVWLDNRTVINMNAILNYHLVHISLVVIYEIIIRGVIFMRTDESKLLD